jgi:hypothetical protein
MRRLAAIIDMPESYLPSCGEPARGGYDVALSADAARYVLSYSEKGDTETIMESSNPDAVMERLFVAATENWAPTLSDGDHEIGPEEAISLLATSTGDLRAMAISHHAETGRVQEELLGQINPEWRGRQALKNVQRAQSIRDFFDQ